MSKRRNVETPGHQGVETPVRRWKYWALAVYVLAVGVRLAFLFEARRNNPLYQYLTTDERLHHETAWAIAAGTAPRTAFLRAPGHLYFLAAIYKVAGPNALVARCVQVFVAGLAPVLVMLTGRRLFGPVVGGLAGILTAVFWTFIFYSTELLDVSLACVLYLFLAYLLIALDDRRWWKWLACGVVLGLGAIVRPNILAFALVLGLLAWKKTGRERFSVAALAGGCVMAIAPVFLRNLIVAGEPVLIGAWGSAVFWATNNPDTDAKRMYRPDVDTSRSPILPDLLKDPWFRWDEHAQSMYIYAADRIGHRPTYREVNWFYTRLSLAYIRDHPGKFLGDVFKRLCFTFNACEQPFNKDLYHFIEFTPLLRALSWLHFGAICPVAIVGLLLAVFRRTWPAGMAYHLAMLLTFVAAGTMFPIIARYRLPIVYLLMPYAAYGIVEVVRMFRPPVRWKKSLQPVGAVAILGVFCNANLFGLRPAHCEYLLFHFMAACMATDRHDLVVRTSDQVEQALNDPSQANSIPPNTMEPMFRYFYARGDLPRAARYGWRMVCRQERTQPATLDALTKVFIHLDDREKARQTLRLFKALMKELPNPYRAQAMFRYGRAFRDREALVEAEQQYLALTRVHPEDPKLRSALAATRRELALAEGPATAPGQGTRP